MSIVCAKMYAFVLVPSSNKLIFARFVLGSFNEKPNLRHDSMFVPNLRHDSMFVPNLRHDSMFVPNLRHGSMFVPNLFCTAICLLLEILNCFVVLAYQTCLINASDSWHHMYWRLIKCF